MEATVSQPQCVEPYDQHELFSIERLAKQAFGLGQALFISRS